MCIDFISILSIDVIASHGLETRFAACPYKDLCNNNKPSGQNSLSSTLRIMSPGEQLLLDQPPQIEFVNPQTNDFPSVKCSLEPHSGINLQ